MDHEGPRWRPGEGRCPVEQCSPVGMGREAVDRVDGGTDRNVMAEDADPLRAFDQASTERATSLVRSEEHTSELQSLMRISYAVFCLKKKKHKEINTTKITNKHTQRQDVTKYNTKVQQQI